MKILIFSFIFIALAIWSYYLFDNYNNMNANNNTKSISLNEENLKNAYFAWGCFWCMEWIFEAQEWVKEAIAWYAGWTKETAKYEIVWTWNTKHREAVKVVYDPSVISYEKLVKLFWTQIDPTDFEWQFADKWFQYTTAIVYSNDEEKEIAEKSKIDLKESKKFDKEIATQIIPFTTFFDAEEYYQDYYKKSSLRYSMYKKWSWREWFIENNWEKDIEKLNSETSFYKDYSPENLKNTKWNILLFFHADWCSTCKNFDKQISELKNIDNLTILKVDFDKETELKKKYSILSQSTFVQIDKEWNAYKRFLWKTDIKDIISNLVPNSEIMKKTLTPLQYEVTQNWWTEKPFDNEYWDNHEDWIYVDIVDWTPLFSSLDKFDSWTGWPSFSKPIEDSMVEENEDDSLFMARTEVKSKSWNSHLGHVFNDWPADKWWMRYCINSAALKFIPVDELEEKGYGKYLKLFVGGK